jgi:microcystin-dependent protein
MVETTTKNYGWVKPEIQHSPATWGGFCNNNFDAIDALVFANQQGVSPVGAISMFAGATPPANWLLCDGAVYQNSSIPLLAPILANQYNAGTAAVAGTSSAVPNLNAKLPLGANASNPVGQTGGTFSYTIALANMPSHAHPITVANPQHYHTIPAWTHTHTAYSDVHTHYVYQDVHAHTVANSPHSHNIVTGNHAHGIATGGHSHGGVVTGLQGGLPGGPIAGGAGGNLIYGNTAAVGNLGGNTDTAGNLGGYTVPGAEQTPFGGISPFVTFTPATVGALFPAMAFSTSGSNGVWTLQSTAASQKYAPPSGFKAWDAP